MDVAVAVAACILALGWLLLATTTATLLLPDHEAAWDRLSYACSLASATSLANLRLRLRISFHLLSTYLIILPLASYLWTIDEVFFGPYSKVEVRQPLITISVPRGGTTSFHRTIALDERFVTPSMLELVMPFLCLHKIVYRLQKVAPTVIQHLEDFLKWINGVTPEVDARHPISLLAPDADDILLGEWHWISVGAVRTFPVANHWRKHYQMNNHSKRQRERSLKLHQRVCQKVLYHRGGHNGHNTPGSPCRLLLRSHLSPCIADFQQLYPDATLVGILRDPVDVLQSFAGLSRVAVLAATGVDMLAGSSGSGSTKSSLKAIQPSTSPWPPLFVEILADMMARESLLYGGDDYGTVSGSGKSKNTPWRGRCHYVAFSDFKRDPVQALRKLFAQIQLPMTNQMESTVQKGLGHHEKYKTRHSYKNPTLQDMDIDADAFLNLPGVKRYVGLLQQQTNLK